MKKIILIDFYSLVSSIGVSEYILETSQINKDFLDLILVLKLDYEIYLISDISKELGEKIKKQLNKYFDGFIFSYEIKYKKSQTVFLEKLSEKVSLENCVLFIDNNTSNILEAKKLGIPGVVYDNFSSSKNEILEKLYKKYENIILGAGASGILYGYLLKQNQKNNFILLEKEPESLGLMRSYQIGNSYYDLGGHALHDNNKNIINFLKEIGGINHYRQKREAYIDYKNRYIPFPFQLHLNYLDKDEKEACFSGFMKKFLEKENKKVNNLDDFLLQKFGKGIYESFLKPYNSKIWKTPLENISINWKNRISYEDLDTFLKGYLEKNTTNFGTNNFVNYPENGGYQKYIDNFYYSISDKINNNIKILSIDTKNKLISTNKGKMIYENIISTIPINELLELVGQEKSCENFEYLSLQIVAILTKKVDIDIQRIYQKEKKYHFHKCAINSNSSESMKKNDETVFQFENSFRKGKKINKEKLIQNYIEFLLEKKFILSKDDVKLIDYKEIKYGYPIQTINMVKIKKSIQESFKKNDINLLGRFGNWDYINFDAVILNTVNLFNKKENENIIL